MTHSSNERPIRCAWVAQIWQQGYCEKAHVKSKDNMGIFPHIPATVSLASGSSESFKSNASVFSLFGDLVATGYFYSTIGVRVVIEFDLTVQSIMTIPH